MKSVVARFIGLNVGLINQATTNIVANHERAKT